MSNVPTSLPVAEMAAPVLRPVSPPPTDPPIVVMQPAGSPRFFRTFAWLGWAGFLFCFFFLMGQMATMQEYFDLTDGIREKFHSGHEGGQQKVAIIKVSGVIVDGQGYVKHQIERVRKDENVKAIVLRVESPGGTVSGSDYILHHLSKLRKEKKLPLVVSMGSMATSGGYYVSMAVGDQEKSIFAEPTTTTGSIGVIIPHYDIADLMERFDVKDDSFVSHPRKAMLSMTRKMDDEQRAIVQAYLNEAFARFKEIVKQGRPKLRNDADRLTEVATGEVFSAETAQKLGLVDEIGFIEEAVERASALASLDKDKVRVIEYLQPKALFDLFGGLTSRAASESTSAALELTTPRAWYLFSSLPAQWTTWTRIVRPRQ